MMRYSYQELKAKAIARNARQADVNALGDWLQEYGIDCWNGEYFNVEGRRLYPIYEETSDEFEITGYEFK